MSTTDTEGNILLTEEECLEKGMQNPGSDTTFIAQENTTIMQDNAGANGDGTTLTMNFRTDDVTIIVNGTGVMVVNMEMTRDGSNWVPCVMQNALLTTVTLVNSVTNPGGETIYYHQRIPGYIGIRARISAFISGSVTVTGIERKR